MELVSTDVSKVVTFEHAITKNQPFFLPGMFSKKFLTNDSNPWGACITELGGSSSSEFGLELGAVFLVSS